MQTSLNLRAPTLRQRCDILAGPVAPAQLLSETSVPGVLSSAPSIPPSVGINGLLAAGLEALDLLGIGLIVSSASGRMQTVNQTAKQTLAIGDGLELDEFGQLRTTQECNPSLGDLLQRVAADRAEVALAVRRERKRALTLLLRPANGSSTAGADGGQPAVLVLVMDSALPANTVDAELRQLYGLTHTETRLAKLLMEGLTLNDCCRHLGIRRTTGCMHLRNVFAKIGVHRQSELVSLLMKSIGLGPRRL